MLNNKKNNTLLTIYLLFLFLIFYCFCNAALAIADNFYIGIGIRPEEKLLLRLKDESIKDVINTNQLKDIYLNSSISFSMGSSLFNKILLMEIELHSSPLNQSCISFTPSLNIHLAPFDILSRGFLSPYLGVSFFIEDSYYNMPYIYNSDTKITQIIEKIRNSRDHILFKLIVGLNIHVLTINIPISLYIDLKVPDIKVSEIHIFNKSFFKVIKDKNHEITIGFRTI